MGDIPAGAQWGGTCLPRDPHRVPAWDAQIAGIAAAVFCCCPLILFCSTKLWIDATFTCLMVLAFHLFVRSYERVLYRGIALAGFVLGLAVLTKYPALGILPAMVWHAFHERTGSRHFWTALLLLGSCTVATCVPWLIWHHAITGALFHSQFTLTQEYANQFPFVQQSLQQPVYYYPRQIAAVAPVYLIGLFSGLRRWKDPQAQVMLIWTATFIAGFTTLALIGQLGYAVRYMLPAAVPLGILTAEAISASPGRLLRLALVLFAFQLTIGIMNSFISGIADVYAPLAPSPSSASHSQECVDPLWWLSNGLDWKCRGASPCRSAISGLRARDGCLCYCHFSFPARVSGSPARARSRRGRP